MVMLKEMTVVCCKHRKAIDMREAPDVASNQWSGRTRDEWKSLTATRLLPAHKNISEAGGRSVAKDFLETSCASVNHYTGSSSSSRIVRLRSLTVRRSGCGHWLIWYKSKPMMFVQCTFNSLESISLLFSYIEHRYLLVIIYCLIFCTTLSCGSYNVYDVKSNFASFL